MEPRISPRYITDYEGANINLTCESDIPVLWKRWKGKMVDTNHLKQNMSLILRNVTIKDKGSYLCIGNKDDEDFTSEVHLFIGGKCEF